MCILSYAQTAPKRQSISGFFGPPALSVPFRNAPRLACVIITQLLRERCALENINLAVLWDMDGTILDTLELHYQTWKEAFSDRPTLFSRELFRAHFGGNNRSTVPIYLGYEPDETYLQQVISLKESLFRQQLAEKTRLFPGIRAWFAYFAELGAKQAVASSAMLENINKVVDSFEIRKYFAALVPGEDLPSKPAPDIFLRAAAILGTPLPAVWSSKTPFTGLMPPKPPAWSALAWRAPPNSHPRTRTSCLTATRKTPTPSPARFCGL